MSKINSSKITSETKEIFKLFLSIFGNLQQERDATISTLNETISKLVAKNSEIVKKIDEFESQSSVNRQSMLNVQEHVAQLEIKLKSIEMVHFKEVTSLKSNIDNNSQYERKGTLILSGPNLPSAAPSENCKLIVQDLLRRETNLNIDPTDISIAHRIGRKSSTLPDKRNIIFKLCRRDLANEIFNACKQSRPSFFVNCSLTPTRNKVLYALRQLKKKFPATVKGCRAQNGGDVVVFVVPSSSASSPNVPTTSRNDRKIVINSREDLEAFASDVLFTSIENLDIAW